MAWVSYVILDGQQFVIKEEELIVELSTTQHPKFYKEVNMIWVWICGA